MVEINNQRKAFLDMLAWSEGTDNGRQKTRNHGYDVIVGGELFTDYSDHPQTCHAKPKTLKSTGAGRYSASFPLVGCLPHPVSLRNRGRCSRYERGALPMIDRGDICQAIDRCATASLPGAGYGQFEHKADSLIAKFKEGAERSERLMYEQSHRDYLRSGYLHHRSACHGLLIITVITYYKAQRDKNARELKLANAAITDMQMRQRDALDAKIHEGVS